MGRWAVGQYRKATPIRGFEPSAYLPTCLSAGVHPCVAPFCVVAIITRRARPLIRIVNKNRTSPISIKACTKQIARGFRELVGNDGGNRIAGAKQRGADLGSLPITMVTAMVSPRARAKAKENRGHNPDAGERHHDLPGGFPLGSAQPQRRFALFHRHRQQYFPRNGDNEGNNHDGQHQSRRQHTGTVNRTLEEGEESRGGLEKGHHYFTQNRDQNENSQQAVNDAGNRRQELDHKGQVV